MWRFWNNSLHGNKGVWIRERRKMSGQTLTDRIAAAQYSLTGSEVARAVCKATTHEVMAPKKKHLECKWVQLKIALFFALLMPIKYT